MYRFIEVLLVRLCDQLLSGDYFAFDKLGNSKVQKEKMLSLSIYTIKIENLYLEPSLLLLRIHLLRNQCLVVG